MRIVFMGTPDFAVPCLKKLSEAGHEICGVFTQQDKPKGRGYVLTPPPVKEFAITHGLEVFQPKTLRSDEPIRLLQRLAPECIVVVAYGKILPQEILEMPVNGCINVHASLLPRYRGAAPIQWSVINGETVTGVTTMYMDAGVDTGDMLLKAETQIGENETAGELHDRLSQMGAELIVETLERMEKGSLQREKQDDSLSCYAGRLDKNLSQIDWNKSAQQVHNLIRGLTPWPMAQTELQGKTLKIHQSRITGMTRDGRAGQVISTQPFYIRCGDGRVLEILEVQLEGKKRMPARDFFRGHPVEEGALLG